MTITVRKRSPTGSTCIFSVQIPLYQQWKPNHPLHSTRGFKISSSWTVRLLVKRAVWYNCLDRKTGISSLTKKTACLLPAFVQHKICTRRCQSHAWCMTYLQQIIDKVVKSFLHFTEPKSTSSLLQTPPPHPTLDLIQSQLNPVHTFIPFCLRSILIFFIHLIHGLGPWSFPVKILCVSYISCPFPLSLVHRFQTDWLTNNSIG